MRRFPPTHAISSSLNPVPVSFPAPRFRFSGFLRLDFSQPLFSGFLPPGSPRFRSPVFLPPAPLPTPFPAAAQSLLPLPVPEPSLLPLSGSARSLPPFSGSAQSLPPFSGSAQSLPPFPVPERSLPPFPVPEPSLLPFPEPAQSLPQLPEPAPNLPPLPVPAQCLPFPPARSAPSAPVWPAQCGGTCCGRGRCTCSHPAGSTPSRSPRQFPRRRFPPSPRSGRPPPLYPCMPFLRFPYCSGRSDSHHLHRPDGPSKRSWPLLYFPLFIPECCQSVPVPSHQNAGWTAFPHYPVSGKPWTRR